MTFISWAQNFEDVMLWRALHKVNSGFYIDVGANDPREDSVTKAFYDRGWRGINIEPVHSHWEDLQRERPHDINLECAAGEATGELELWEPEVRGWASADSNVIAKHEKQGYHGVRRTVPVRTLKDICAEYVRCDINFLKIDVEGFEHSVLAGMDFKRFRPWLVVVEATEPMSATPAHEQWEGILTDNQYNFVYDDGINRFYAADEKQALGEVFSRPPNVLDDFVRASEYELRTLQQVGVEAVVDRDHWREAAGFLQSENERREAALVDYRQRREAAENAESAERMRLLETVEFLRGENERREAALVDYRQQLEAAENAESAERMRLLETVEFLRGENERREAALADYRQQLEAADDAESAERTRLLETVEFLRGENERREAALVDYRQRLEAAGDVQSAERTRLLETIEFLQIEHRKNEGQLIEKNSMLADAHVRLADAEAQAESARESFEQDKTASQLALLALRGQFDEAAAQFEQERTELAWAIRELRDEVGARSKEAEDLQTYSGQLSHRLSVLVEDLEEHRIGLDASRLSLADRLMELDSLRGKVRDDETEIMRLNQLIDGLHASTSWRITKPLRQLKSAGGKASRGVRHLAYQSVRRQARWLRPALRWVIQWRWPRKVILALVGRDSRLIDQARLFLFGVPDTEAQPPPPGSFDKGGMSGQALRIMNHIEHVHAVRELPMLRADRELMKSMDTQALRVYMNIQMLRAKQHLDGKQ